MTSAEVVRIVLLLIVLAGAGYTLLAIFAVSRFFNRRKTGVEPSPVPVSIIKPLKGTDPELYDNILSFCRQDYPQYEVILGFADPDDDAIIEAERIVRELPDRDIRIVISFGDIGANRKVSNLQGLSDAAKYPLLAVSDSDMRVGADYLKKIVSEYQDRERAGLVTCLYKISDPKSIGAAFESLNIALDFIPSVVVAGQLEGITFGLGASMLLSNDDLNSVGGFTALADYLADDYQLGNRLWKKGYKIILSDYVIEDVVGSMSLREHITHQLRWARTIRASRPLGLLGYGITHILPISMLLVIIGGPDTLSMSVLGLAVFARISLSMVLLNKVIRQSKWVRWLLLLPVKDCLSFAIWLWSFLGSEVSWRGERYEILKGGRIRRIKP
ncbi:MAG TPA: bacteriohopanetetrol glucosamine biosynthesis glycosyltransferase HpnI [Dissulfurispiraceae bacterium]|nr:bacteriohopanetetrol glucosamine biosynthesis glycosyltransferase HpnI [Dissulfurispiraceae bacterium]